MSEQFGRCRSEVVSARDSYAEHAAIADAIDRLAADVAAVKEAVGRIEAVAMSTAVTLTPTAEQAAALRAAAAEIKATPAAPQPAAQPAGWLTEEERRGVESAVDQLRGLATTQYRNGDHDAARHTSRQADFADAFLARAGSSPVVEVPAGWLTEEERAVVEDLASRIEQWLKMAWNDIDEKRCVVLRSILSRAGSPPVVEVPVIDGVTSARIEARAYRAAMDKAGVKWREVGRE